MEIYFKNKNNYILLGNKIYLFNIKSNFLKRLISIILIWNFIFFNQKLKKNKSNYLFLTKENYSKNISNKTIIYLKAKLINYFNSYINMNINGILANKKKYPLLLSPKISVIMPVYNAEKYLIYSIRSIQNQIMKEIEIILIDDCSTDNTWEVIQDLMNNDPRIRLIKNLDNRKILYSKSIGALNSNGKYILELDQDDMFLRKDLFEILYFEAENNNLDLVHFRNIQKDKFYFEKNESIIIKNSINLYTHIETQPKLKEDLFIDSDRLFLLWGLLIRTDLYKKAIYNLWPIIINYKIIQHEDFIITSIIVVLSRKYKFLDNFGIIHLMHKNSSSFKYYNEYYLGVLFDFNILYDYYVDNNPKDIIISFNFIKRYWYIFRKCNSLYNKLYLFSIIKILKNPYLTNDMIQKIKALLKIDEKSFNILNSYKYFMNSKEYKKIFHFQKSINKKIDIFNKIVQKVYISIIILCFELNSLEKTLNSINKQNFEYFELIIIYDDNDKINNMEIKIYLQKYNGIKIINNVKDKGILYSLCIGVLSAKGQYVLIIKSGETLAKKSILKKIYKEAIINNLDILEFDLLINNNNEINKNSFYLYKCRHIKSELNLTILKYNNDYPDIDQNRELLSNKIIKTIKFQSIIKKYNLVLIKNKIFNCYDKLILFLLSKDTNKMIHSNIFGIIHFKNNKFQINNTYFKETEIKDNIFYFDFLMDNTNNSIKEKKIVLEEFYNHLNIIYNKYNKITKESYKLFQKFINCIFISQFDKNRLIIYYKSLNL